jgi:hypothetical protein
MKALETLTALFSGYPMSLWAALTATSIVMGASLWIALGKFDEKD